MPQVFKVGTYIVYFWINEGMPLEPIHVHVAEGKPVANGTKIWITEKGRALLANNAARIPQAKLNIIMDIIEARLEGDFCLLGLAGVLPLIQFIKWCAKKHKGYSERKSEPKRITVHLNPEEFEIEYKGEFGRRGRMYRTAYLRAHIDGKSALIICPLVHPIHKAATFYLEENLQYPKTRHIYNCWDIQYDNIFDRLKSASFEDVIQRITGILLIIFGTIAAAIIPIVTAFPDSNFTFKAGPFLGAVVCIAMGSVVISMKISFYYVDENYIKYLKEKEISARGFTCVPNVEYHNQRTQN